MKQKDLHKESTIIEKTLDIVSETGIKMSVLAKHVGVSPSTLYVYFETKEDLNVLKDLDESTIYAVMSGVATQMINIIKSEKLKLSKKMKKNP
ncbi:MAG: TetR/AcrR family transcriptional regulator [Chitinophagales bacterium]|nr:TetR/AcrR family transcriptional regulator [Chitinophagales bacterium]